MTGRAVEVAAPGRQQAEVAGQRLVVPRGGGRVLGVPDLETLQAVLDRIADLRVVSGTGVGHVAYMRELRASKICFSPFGYGEVCWRDYEAILSGAVLLKPDMSHIETDPDVFVAGETYLPVRWDLADFEAQVRLAFANLQASLAAGGCGLDDIVDVTSFHTDPERQFDTIMKVKGEVFPAEPYPNWTAVGVTWLAGFDFEIKVIARIPA